MTTDHAQRLQERIAAVLAGKTPPATKPVVKNTLLGETIDAVIRGKSLPARPKATGYDSRIAETISRGVASSKVGQATKQLNAAIQELKNTTRKQR